VARRRSRLHGWGVFALEDIPKNKRIIAYLGERISHAESLRRERRYIRNGNIWCFRLNRRWVIDANVGGNDARFINHSCRPNCYTQVLDGTIWVRAARTIAAGEELTYNYYTDGEGLIQCRCRPGCKGLL
jgi:SET domain-containing protein